MRTEINTFTRISKYKHTTGAAIYPKGGYAAKYHDFGSSIFGMDSEVEFIEIESMDTMF